MNAIPRKVERTVWGVLTSIILIIAVLFIRTRLQPASAPLPVLWTVPAFTLTNQLGAPVSADSLRGKVWVANTIFTRCAGPCPELTRRMSQIQKALAEAAPVQLVTLTTDPEYDTPSELKKYGERFGANADRWWFLTGPKRAIADLVVGGLKMTALEKKPEERENLNDLFIHSTILVLVDPKGRVRGTVETLEAGWKEKALQSVDQLLREKAP